MTTEDFPEEPDLDPETLPPQAASANEDATHAPALQADDEHTIPPTAAGSGEVPEATIGDQMRYFGDYELVGILPGCRQQR